MNTWTKEIPSETGFYFFKSNSRTYKDKQTINVAKFINIHDIPYMYLFGYDEPIYDINKFLINVDGYFSKMIEFPEV